ncbi:hypothetical protein SAMN04489712_13238 [Thermomonospora echinospora]|uniref:Lipoprotein n=1 Tax=Thermomonospora echinospora TaxID=1992 RepID=A0A1H6E558_9ACTN|nr:hypothetical protein [Thermomonospora echinospora]SEG92144.1 hypothetical protein SAMN04489712_13238 [Thermomonospora echinospora]
MRSTVRRFVSVLGAVALLSTAACTNEEPGPQASGRPTVPGPPTTRLLYALSQVTATEENKRHVEFTDLAALRRVSNGRPFDRRFGLLAVGAGELAGFAERIAQPTGIDLSQATDALVTGSTSGDAGRINGPFDAKTIGAKLTGLGYTPVPGVPNAWAGASEDGLDADDPLVKLGVTASHGLNVVRVDSGEGITYARQRDALRRIPAERGSGSLADEPAHRAVAGCLGTAIAAVLLVDEPQPHPPNLVGVGVTSGASAGDLRQIMCVQVDGDAAAAVRTLQRTLREGSSRTGTAWQRLLPEATVEQAGDGMIRLTATPAASAGPGLLIRALIVNDLPRWRG